MTAASLDNTGSIYLDGSSANQALLDVTAGSAGFGTAGVLSGNVRLAGDSAIEFASGQITSLAASAHLDLNGNDAFIEDSTALGSNSALTGLASIGAGRRSSSKTGPRCRRPARSSMTETSISTPTRRRRRIEPDGGGGADQQRRSHHRQRRLSASDEVTAASLDNTGSIYLDGSSANQALLDVTTGSAGFGTAGVLSGNVDSGRRQRDRVRERADHQPGRWRAIVLCTETTPSSRTARRSGRTAL